MSMNNIYHQYWEQELLHQFITDDRSRKIAYVCSPLSAKKEEEFIQNMRSARAYMFYAMKEMGVYARAPHAYLPMLLCDQVPSERALAIQFGLRLMEESDVILICGNRLSSGMKGEIAHAALFKMPMVVFDVGMYHKVQEEITKHGGNKCCVQLDRENYVMGFPSPVSYLEKAVMFRD